jgi:hypothetical protein
MMVRSNQNRPDFADAQKLFLLCKHPCSSPSTPRDSDSPGPRRRAIFALPKYPQGLRLPRENSDQIATRPNIPQGHDGSYFALPKCPQGIRLPGTMIAQDQTSDDLPPPPPKMVRASYSMGCKASLRLPALTPAISRLWDLIVETLREWEGQGSGWMGKGREGKGGSREGR